MRQTALHRRVIGSHGVVYALSTLLLVLMLAACGTMSTPSTGSHAPRLVHFAPLPATPAASPTAFPTPTAGPTQAPSTGFALSVTPRSGPGGGMRIDVDVAPADVGRETFTVTFLPAPFDKPVGTRAHPLYTGPIWPSTWQVHPNQSGRFSVGVKVPHVLQPQDSDQLWLIEPGVHELVLLAGSRQVASAHYVVELPPTPSPAGPPALGLSDAAFVDADHGWVIGSRCQAPAIPTPDVYGKVATPPPASCQGAIEYSADGGRSWMEQSLGDPRLIPRAIQFVDPNHGWIAVTTLSCTAEPCDSVIFRTADGGRHWDAAFHTGPNAPALSVQGRAVAARSVALTTLAFTSAQEGWVLGTACASADAPTCDPGAGLACTVPNLQICQPVLYATHDGGVSWGQIALPESLAVFGKVALSHPTANDGWIVSGGHIFATHDGGRTWQELPDPAPESIALGPEIFFRSATQGWLLVGTEPGAGRQLKTLYETTDGGQQWTRIAAGTMDNATSPLPSTGYVGPIVFTTAEDGWINSPRAGVLQTSDGGKTWRAVPNLMCGDGSCLAMGFTGSSIGWVVSDFGSWLTTDGGKEWKPVTVAGVHSQP